MTSASRTTETGKKFMSELNEEAERVQDVPPTRRREFDERTGEP